MGSSSPKFRGENKKYLKFHQPAKVLTSYDHFQLDTLVMAVFLRIFLPNYPTKKIQCMGYLPFANSPFQFGHVLPNVGKYTSPMSPVGHLFFKG